MEEAITIDSIKTLFENSDLPDTVQTFKTNGSINPYITAFNTDLIHGINEIEMDSNFEQRREKWGSNDLKIPEKKSFISLFFNTFSQLPTRIFLLAIVLWFILIFVFPPNSKNDFSDFIEFISAVIGIIIISSIQAAIQYIKQKKFNEMYKLDSEYNVSVIRYGKPVQIKNTEILVGDILRVKSGDVIPADGIFIAGYDLRIKNPHQSDQSSIVSVSEDNPFFLADSSVISGKGRILICAVGSNSTSYQKEPIDHKSNLETKLNSLSFFMNYFGFISSVLIFIILSIFWFIDAFKQKQETYKFDPRLLPDLASRLIISIAIYLCCVPEGLLNVIEICFGFSLQKLISDQIILSNPNSLELMSHVTTICVNKNGSIVDSHKIQVEKVCIDNEIYTEQLTMPDNVKAIFSNSIALNMHASLMLTSVHEDPQFIGSPIECALLKYLTYNHIDYRKTRNTNQIVYSIDLNNKDNLMYSIANQNDTYYCYIKGSPDELIQNCNRYIDKTGNVQPLDESKSLQFENINATFANSGLSTLLIAYKEIDSNAEFTNLALIKSDLVIIGIIGTSNPLVHDTKAMIEELNKGNIDLLLLNNENLNISKTIGRSTGILSGDSIAIDHSEFVDKSKSDLIDYISQVKVISHISSEDKLRFVSLLMESGDVVAATCDTTNDCELLKKSDVGISFQSSNNEMIKMNSDISMRQEGLIRIVNACKWGRSLYDNIQCYIQYQLIANITAVILTLVGSCIFKVSPFQIVSLIWIYLIIDNFAAIALLTRIPCKDLSTRLPYSPSEPIISKTLLRNIIGHIAYQVIVFIIIIVLSQSVLKIDINEGRTRIVSIIFNTYMYCQIFNLINARSANDKVSILYGLFSSPFFISIFVIILILQPIFITFCQSSFLITRPGLIDWVASIVFGLVELFIGFALRCIKIGDQTKENWAIYKADRRNRIKQIYKSVPIEEQWEMNIENIQVNSEIYDSKNDLEGSRPNILAGADNDIKANLINTP